MSKQKKNILDKKISELSADDLKKIERPIGTSALPYPMTGTQRSEEDGEIVLKDVLSDIADDQNPLKIYSSRSYKEVAALAICDMPVPSMLPHIYEIMERYRPDSKNRTYMMIGDPGDGKSYLGALVQRLQRDDKPAEVVDCGGKNIRDLLFEMVLDFGDNNGLPTAIDKKIQTKTLSDAGAGALKLLNGLEKGIVSEDKDGNIKSVDWTKLKTGDEKKIRGAKDILMDVRAIEGLDKGGENALGMSSQLGLLPRLVEEGGGAVLDEYNKSREGTDDTMQTVLQWWVGEIDECTIENPLKSKGDVNGPSHYTFSRDKQKLSNFLVLTGNKKEDGITTRSLNKSVYSRLQPETLSDRTVEDWQHRIQQYMMGIPVSTLYSVPSYRKFADENPEAFGDWLLELRRTKAEMEGTVVPAHQEDLIRNWKQVNSATRKLANFYHEACLMTDSEKVSEITDYSHLVMEVDEEFTKKEGVDYRKLRQHLQQATPLRPQMRNHDSEVAAFSPKGWDKQPDLPEKREESVALRFGTRLMDLLDDWVHKISDKQGRPELGHALRELMEKSGLRDMNLQEGAYSKQKSAEEDLNISSFNDKNPDKQASMARKVFCDYLRERDQNISAEDDESIVTLTTLKRVLEDINRNRSEGAKVLMVPNMDHETLQQRPLVEATIVDSATAPLDDDGEGFNWPSLEETVSHDDFMVTLAMPAIGENNLSSVWDDNLSRRLIASEMLESAENKLADAQHILEQIEQDMAAGASEDVSKEQMEQAKNEAKQKLDDAKKSYGDVFNAIKDIAGIDLDSSEEHMKLDDPSMRLAENRSDNGLALTTVMVRQVDESGDRHVPVHILRNEARGKALVVSEEISPRIQSLFTEAGITHINRSEPGAQSRIDSALTDILRGVDDSVRLRLVDAFRHRNDTEQAEMSNPAVGQSLSAMMTSADVECDFPKYVVKRAPKAPKQAM